MEKQQILNMKTTQKTIVSSILGLALCGLAYAEPSETQVERSVPDKAENVEAMKSFFVKEDGKVMMMKDGEKTAIEEKVVLENGTTVMPDGAYMEKDSTDKMMLEDGDKMELDGVVVKNPKNNDVIQSRTIKPNQILDNKFKKAGVFGFRLFRAQITGIAGIIVELTAVSGSS